MSKLKVKNSEETIEVNNVYCIGRNYHEHIKEMGYTDNRDDVKKAPVVFLKPNSAINSINGMVTIPEISGIKISGDLQNEVELVIIIGEDGINISEDNALEYIYGYAVGIDFTLRDLQTEMKKKGLPWAVSKGFFSSAPVSEITLKGDIGDIRNLNITLSVNGETRQNANTSQMIYSVEYMIHYLSSIFSLKKGDIIFTGTPAGVSTLKTGDIVEASIEEIGNINIKVV